MLKKSFLMSLLLMFILNGCEKIPSIQDRFAIAKLTTINNYKIIKADTSIAIGDYSESITLIISQNDYNQLVKEIKEKPFFIEYNLSEHPQHIYSKLTSFSKFKEVAYSYEGNIHYSYFNPNDIAIVNFILKKDSILIIEYRDL